MRRYKFRALITMDFVAQEQPARRYSSGTRRLMVRCSKIDQPWLRKYFPAVIFLDDERPLTPGETRFATIQVTDDDACAFLGPGQQVTLWNGTDAGHGIVSRRVFFTWGAA